MRTQLLILFCIQFLFASKLQAISPPVKPFLELRSKQENAVSSPLFLLRNTTTKMVEYKIGRKLKLKEKIALQILKWQQRKKSQFAKESGKKNKAKTAFILGLAGAIALFVPVLNLASIPLAIMAIVIGNKAKREDPGNRKAKTAVTLGILTLSFLVVIGLLVAIVVTFGSIGPR